VWRQSVEFGEMGALGERIIFRTAGGSWLVKLGQQPWLWCCSCARWIDAEQVGAI
jgi:hypothetical protein